MLTKLSARHREILRRTFLGESSTAIAQVLGITARACRKVRQAPEFREALEELHRRAEASLVDVPKRLELEQRLTEAAEKGIGVAEQIMLDPKARPGIRSRNAFEFLDRAGLTPMRTRADGGEKSLYREILEHLDEIERTGVSVEATLKVTPLPGDAGGVP